ncbi:MAG TPA: carbohydrate ABC transporter permease [Spirochaetia bacterium]|nr:carbohydrate ABC transporter permease [Spirochaetia bacterium]
MRSLHAAETRVNVLLILFFLVLCVAFLFPIYSLLLASFRPGRDLMRFGITVKTLAPGDLSLKYLASLLTARAGAYTVWYRNSLILVVMQTGLSLFFSSLVGYGLGVYEFRGRRLIFSLVLLVLVVPIQILILPLYSLLIFFKSMNTFWGIVAPFVVSPFAVFFFRQYVIGIPMDFIDAGRIDGLREGGIFFRVVAPLMKPAFGAMAILTALQSWNNFLWPLIVLRTGNMFTLPIGLASLLSPYGNNYDMLISGSLMATLPILVIFFIFQRYFIAGLTTGGIKG